MKAVCHFIWMIVSGLCLLGITAQAQEINLDKMEKCNDLFCYQSLKDPNTYYYLPDQPRLAVKDGRPQFSFLKYARTRETGKAGVNRAQGGGIVHFLVTYGVTEARVAAAENALKERHPDARIAGPIVYRRGSFALITSFKEGDQYHTCTVAVGKAPLMEGQKAAVSMALTRAGAELLWESFKTDTPDISLVFDMQFAGVREPYEAILEADWKRVSSHHRVKAGVKVAWFGADVDILLQELKQDGAIKITTKGKDAVLDKILDSAHAKMLQVMFNPSPTDELSRAAAEKGSYDSLNQAVHLLKNAATTRRRGSARRRSSLDNPYGLNPDIIRLLQRPLNALFELTAAEAHAAAVPAAARPTGVLFAQKPGTSTQTPPAGDSRQLTPLEKRAQQAFYRGSNAYAAKRYADALKAFRESLRLLESAPAPDPQKIAPSHYNIGRVLARMEKYTDAAQSFRRAAQIYGPKSADGRESLQKANEAEARAGGRASGGGRSTGDNTPGASAGTAYSEARRLYDQARAGGFQADATRRALTAYENYLRDHAPTGERRREVEGRIRMLRARLARTGTATSSQPGSGGSIPATSSVRAPKTMTTPSRQPSATPASSKTGRQSTAATRRPTTRRATARPASRAQRRRSNGSAGFSLVASYRMKKIKRSGKMVYQMNHYRTEKQSFAMTENIGSLFKQYGRDSNVFRAVTIDDPVFKQREILVTLDGQDAATFTKHLNFVTVQMKKRHQNGDVSSDEVIITPEKFNRDGNAFVLSYGYKGDDDRTVWLDYEYQTTWSFHGGVQIRHAWTVGNTAMLALQPPHRYRSVTIEGQGDKLSRAQVRHAVVHIDSRVGDRTMSTQTTIRNTGPAPAMVLDIPEDRANPSSQVGITWYLTGGRQLKAPPQAVVGDIIYWDELPK